MDSPLNAKTNRIIREASKRGATHIHLTVDAFPLLRVDDRLVEMKEEQRVTSEFIKLLQESWLDEAQQKQLETDKAYIFTTNLLKQTRAKISFFYQRGDLSLEVALIPSKIPSLTSLGLPKPIYALSDRRSGLVIIGGSVGAGRSTTLAAFLEEINKTRKEKIMTVERPIEYLFSNNKSIFEQREVPQDSNTFVDSIIYAQQSNVNVLAVAEDSEDRTVPEIFEFANSGRLAFLIVDAASAVQAIEQVLSRFSEKDSKRAQIVLSEILQAVIIQRLLPKTGGGTVLACETLIKNDAVSSLIAENKLQQLNIIIQSSREEGMVSFDQSLAELVKSGSVLIDRAIQYARDPADFRKMAI